MRPTFALALCLAVYVCGVATSCDSYETIASDGRVRVAEGAFTEAYVLVRGNEETWFAAVETSATGEHLFEFMRLDGSDRCTAATLEGEILEISSTGGYNTPIDEEIVISVVDGTDGVGTMHFFHLDCTELTTPFSGVVAPSDRFSGLLGAPLEASWLLQNEDGDLHLVYPAQNRDVTIAEGSTWHASIGPDTWYVANGQLYVASSNSSVGPIGSAVSEAVVVIAPISRVGYGVMFVDSGQLYMQDGDPTIEPVLVSAESDVCRVQALGGISSYVAWTSPCDGGDVHIVTLSHRPIEEALRLPGPIGSLLYRDGDFIYVRDSNATPTLALMTPSAGAYSEFVFGPGTDVRSVRRRAFDRDFEAETEDLHQYYVTLDRDDGSNAWGLWAPGTGFETLETNVGRVYLLSLEASDEDRQLLLVTTDEDDGNADIQIYSRSRGIYLAEAENLRLSTLGSPFGSRAITYLRDFDTERGTGDLVGVSITGSAVELEHGVSMYSSLELPFSAMVYTIPEGDRRGLWMWVGGR